MTYTGEKCARPKCHRYSISGKYCWYHFQALKNAGQVGMRDATRAKLHVDALYELGWNPVWIAREAGISFTPVRRLGIGDLSRIHTRIEKAILSVPLEAPEGHGDVPSIGAVRRVQALQWMQWPLTEISQRSGVTDRTLRSLGCHDKVRRFTHDRIAAVYDELSMTLGPSKIAGAKARKKGAVSPLCWDEDSIDDPAAKPEGDSRHRRARYLRRAA